MRALLRSLWDEPRAPDPPPRSWYDWALVGVLVPLAAGEALLRPDVHERGLAMVFAVLPLLSLLWRRSQPLAAVAVAFGAHAAGSLLPYIGDHHSVELYSAAAILLLPYALLRWGSGRESVVGIGIVLLTHAFVISEIATAESLVGIAILLLPAALGAAVRFRDVSRARELDQVKLREREQLARELHDTVAHHVSAIAVQAQAGRIVAGTDPQAAATALQAIEAEALRTLTEIRAIVGVLRNGEDAAYAPQPGVADLGRLLAGTDGSPTVEVAPSGNLDDLTPSVDAALYRLAQESITNALRHARHATRIVVAVAGDRDCVRLTVTDDGEALPFAGPPAGYGIVGMTERATLLGGTLAAGPNPDQRVDGRRRAPPPRGPVTIRVLVADDQELVRTGLTMILDAQAGIEVVATAADGHEAVALARARRPDVCLFDIRMPGMDGIAATRALAGPGVDEPMAVVIITTFDLDEYVHAALKAGARGFLLKDAGPELLTQAVRAAAAGDTLIAPNVTVRLLSAFADAAPAVPVQPVDPLTEREEEVLLTVARGCTNAEIATDLHISLSTVKTHLGSLMAKLGARNRVEIAMWAYETGRVPH